MTRARFNPILRELLAASEDSRLIDIDDLAAALAPFDASHEEIDYVIEELERAGRSVDVKGQANATDDLKLVLPLAQSLRATLGRTPTIGELDASSSLGAVRIQRALLLGRVLGRGRRV